MHVYEVERDLGCEGRKGELFSAVDSLIMSDIEHQGAGAEAKPRCRELHGWLHWAYLSPWKRLAIQEPGRLVVFPAFWRLRTGWCVSFLEAVLPVSALSFRAVHLYDVGVITKDRY